MTLPSLLVCADAVATSARQRATEAMTFMLVGAAEVELKVSGKCHGAKA